LLLLMAAWAAPGAQAASDDVLSSLNWARQRGCNPSAVIPLESNLRLQKAARRVAAGASLRDALAAEGYVASESSELHISGAVSPAEITHALSANFCTTLADPKLRDIGAQRRGSEIWILLAAPVAAPAAEDAGAVRRRILELVNAARAAGRRCGPKYFAPSAPLTLNTRLNNAALAHSREMARYGEFDHRGHDGSTPESRVERAGFGAYRIVGENIAAGAMSPAEVAEGWLSSPAHCENIMDGRFTEMGIAYTANPKSAAGMYWAQDFAAPR
jgi:uncharacterized protein YkwD